MDRTSRSRNRRGGGGRVGNSECWDGDRRRPVGRMTLCGRRIFWVGDRGRPGGNINLCGIYGGDYSSRGCWAEYITISGRV